MSHFVTSFLFLFRATMHCCPTKFKVCKIVVILLVLLVYYVLSRLANLETNSSRYTTTTQINKIVLRDWWRSHPDAPIGLSCHVKTSGTNSLYHQRTKNENNIFEGRTPIVSLSSTTKRRLAFVVPFVEFQTTKLRITLRKHWAVHAPCSSTGNKQQQQLDADLILVTPLELSQSSKEEIRATFRMLAPQTTGCFANGKEDGSELKFVHTGSVEKEDTFSHLEGAANSFYTLFPLLEQNYNVFFIAEPDVVPVQDNWLEALVEASTSVNCEDDGLWQLGSAPLDIDVDVGSQRKRVDFHLNGNALYALGCSLYEDYKCRVQTFYAPKGECSLVGGCSTYRTHEGGYDHAMYRFRMHPDNYEYSRNILHHFAYTKIIQNRGEGAYDALQLVEESPSTFLVHSKSVFLNSAATMLKEAFATVISAPVCHWYFQNSAKRIYQYLRTGEIDKGEATKMLCNTFPIQIKLTKMQSLCSSYEAPSEQKWEDRMPGKTYLWSMDFHGGPVNCDIPVITAAGGAIHAEIDGICEHFGLCKDRLKVIKANKWQEFDPTDVEIEKFKIAYENDDEFKRVDAFICHHPAANCELFLPFDKPIIIHATTRIEFGRHDAGIDWRLGAGYEEEKAKRKWRSWISTIMKLDKDKRNIIAANNAYDAEYIKHFTGVDAMLLPSWCGRDVGIKFCDDGWESSIPKEYKPTRREVMIVPYRSNLGRSRFEKNLRNPKDHPVIKSIDSATSEVGTQINLISDIYEDSNPLHMTNHPAIVIMPYQISTINLVELYRLNIPSFCPSLKLLKQWCKDHDLMWEVHYGWPERLDDLLGGATDIPDPNGKLGMDKNSDEWERQFDYWVPLADFYKFEHIVYFDSWQDFYDKFDAMTQADLHNLSENMRKVNALVELKLVDQWKEIFARLQNG